MTEEEISRAFEELTDTLDAIGLAWVVEQVQDEIAFGRPESVRLPDRIGEQRTVAQEDHNFPSIEVSDSGGSTGRKAEFITAQDYSTEERLLLLLDAMEQVIVKSSEMEEESIATLEELGGITSIQFGDWGEGFTTSQVQITLRRQAATRLAFLIQMMRDGI